MEMWLDHTGVDERGIHRKRARPPKGDGALEIDLTPMLDVVMIMLIFFIVAGSFIREIGIEVQRKPTSSAESDAPSENIIVQVAANDEIWIKGRRIDARESLSWRDFGAYLHALYLHDPRFTGRAIKPVLVIVTSKVALWAMGKYVAVP